VSGSADVADNSLSAELRYDRTSIRLHWATALLVILLWVIAQLIDDFPRGQARIAARSVHITLGVVLLVVLLARLRWRSGSGRRLPLAPPGWVGYLAKTVHYLLYALLAAVLLLGITNVWVRGDSYFGLFAVPKLDPGNKGLKETVEDLHEILANTLLILAGVHAVAALVHHFVLRDGVLRRMFPGGSPK
jgi:cytochrome b561